MRISQADKLVPITLITIAAGLIIMRIAGVGPYIVATNSIDVSQTLFMDAGVSAVMTVFSIVISLTLMSVQTASQEYTHRIMKTYMQSFMLWAMNFIYLGTVIYNIFMIAFIKEPVDTVFADIVVILVMLCIIMLIPHFFITLAYLRPDFIIGTILQSVDREYLALVRKTTENGEERIADSADRLLPAVEIIEKCVEKKDRATVRIALGELHRLYKSGVTGPEDAPIALYFIEYFLRIGRESIIDGDDDSVVQVLGIMSAIGKTAPVENITNTVIDDINAVGLLALKEDYDAAVEKMVDSLCDIACTRTSPEILTMVLDSMSEIAAPLFSGQKKKTAIHLIGAMLRLKDVVIKNKNQALVVKWTAVMEEIGLFAITEKVREITHRVISTLCEAGSALAREDREDARYTVDTLLRLEHEIDESDRELTGEIEYARRQIQGAYPKKANDNKEPGLDTTDLWR